MQTPHGIFCKYYFSDYFRGNAKEDCRLLNSSQQKAQWSNALCKTCPVPKILLANACPNMTLNAKIARGFLGFNKKVEVSAYCIKSQAEVKEPEVGCGLCHDGEFVISEDQP